MFVWLEKMAKYSSLRNALSFDKLPTGANSMAFLTHMLQAKSEEDRNYFLSKLDEALNENLEKYQIRLPLEFDVPFPPVRNPSFRFIDLFAGIGGFRLAFQDIGGACVFSSEWDKFSQKTYEHNFGELPFGDITQITRNSPESIRDHDVLLGGFPCQPFSLAGVSKKNSLGREHGFLDKTQGTLFFDIATILKAKKPKALLLENVKNLKSHDGGRTFEIIEDTLEGLDYHIFSKVIDARHWVPQHRERIFIVGFHKDHFPDKPDFSFPDIPTETNQSLFDILDPNPHDRYTISDKLWTYLKDYAEKHRKKGNGFGYGLNGPQTEVSRTLSARYHKDGSEILISQGARKNPRRLTPEECKRLMGFPDEFDISNIGISDTQLYRQFGNSVAVPVVRAIAAQMAPFINDDRKVKQQELSLMRSELISEGTKSSESSREEIQE